MPPPGLTHHSMQNKEHTHPKKKKKKDIKVDYAQLPAGLDSGHLQNSLP